MSNCPPARSFPERSLEKFLGRGSLNGNGCKVWLARSAAFPKAVSKDRRMDSEDGGLVFWCRDYLGRHIPCSGIYSHPVVSQSPAKEAFLDHGILSRVCVVSLLSS